MGTLSPQNRRHLAVLLIALALLLAQFIVEALAVYSLMNLFPETGASLLSSKTAVALVHAAITLVLIGVARAYGRTRYPLQ